MRRLFPVTDETATRSPEPGSGHDWSLAELAAAYAYPELGPGPGTPEVWLRANMVSTLDGAAQHDGRSQPISTATDMRIFGTLRALADVVIAGAETVRQEGYRPARVRDEFAGMREAAGQGPVPAIAVITASLDLDFSLPLYTSPLVPTLILTGAAAAPDRIAAAEKAGARVVIAGDGVGVDPARAVRALAELGHTRLLTEGGPRLLGQLVAAGVLDELCLTLSPMLTAGARSASPGAVGRGAGAVRTGLPAGGGRIPLQQVPQGVTVRTRVRSVPLTPTSTESVVPVGFRRAH